MYAFDTRVYFNYQNTNYITYIIIIYTTNIAFSVIKFLLFKRTVIVQMDDIVICALYCII